MEKLDLPFAKHAKKLALSVLVVLAIILAIFIYKENAPSQKETLIVLPPKIDSSSFSADEIKLLHPPGLGATTKEIDTHAKLAAKLAVVGSEVDINNCRSTPLVLQSYVGTAVTFKNTGNSDISLSFEKDVFTKIAKGKSISTSKLFTHGPGLYGYLCKEESFSGLVGFVLLAPQI